MIRSLYICALFILAFSSCEKEVQLDIKPIDAKLVVISNFNDGRNFSFADTLMRVTVARTTGAFSNSDSLAYVSNAIVDLYRGEQFLERLDYYKPTKEEEENGIFPYYSTEVFEPVRGEIYRLEVSAPNFSPVSAIGYIPFVDSESSIVNLALSEEITVNGFTEVEFTLVLDIENLKETENFYHVNLYQVTNALRIDLSAQDTFRTEEIPVQLPFDLLDHNKEALTYINKEGVLIRDKDINGTTGSFKLNGTFFYNKDQKELSRFLVEIRNVSPDYYYYHSSLTRQVRVREGFDAINGPVVIYNNIENGCGIFAGYSTDIISIDLAN